MKYANPLQKTPGINTMLAILSGAKTTKELLKLEVANNRNTLYEIIDALEKEKLIFKYTEKPLLLKPNFDSMLVLLQTRQAHHGLGILLPEIKELAVKRIRYLRNKNDMGQILAAIQEISNSISQEDKIIAGQEFVKNTPEPITLLMLGFLKNIPKIKTAQRKELMQFYSVFPLKHFCEFFDGFFAWLVLEGYKFKKKFKGKNKEDYVAYLEILRGSWNKNQIFLGTIERNKKLAEFYKKELLPVGL